MSPSRGGAQRSAGHDEPNIFSDSMRWTFKTFAPRVLSHLRGRAVPAPVLGFALTLGILCGIAEGASSSPATDSAVREKLAKAILSEGSEQQELLSELADSGSKVVREILTAWTRDGIYLWPEPGGDKIPVVLEEQQDGEGKTHARRIADGQL